MSTLSIIYATAESSTTVQGIPSEVSASYVLFLKPDEGGKSSCAEKSGLTQGPGAAPPSQTPRFVYAYERAEGLA